MENEKIFCGNNSAFGFVQKKDIRDFNKYNFVKVEVKYLKSFLKIINMFEVNKISFGIKDNQSILVIRKSSNEEIVFAIAPICEED